LITVLVEEAYQLYEEIPPGELRDRFRQHIENLERLVRLERASGTKG